MAADVPSALAVQQQVAQLLADFSQPDALTASLVALVTLTEPASSLLLSTALNQLIGSTFSLDPSRPDPAQIAAYLHDSLFAAIGRGDGGEADEAKLERKAALADAIIDVAWQLDQQVDTQVPLMWRRANPPAPVEISAIQQPAAEKMEVDAAEPKVDNLEAEKTRQAAAVVEEARQRLAQIVKQLVQSGDLPREAVLERLELPFIRFLGILPDPNFFQRLEVRQRTALYYKQQKFNLLREESEGYSKLVVELLGSMGPPLSPLYASSQESEAARMKRARSVNDRVKNLIGNFDLDPSRTLDVLLDTFSDHVVEHWQFFLDVLAVSPWAPKQLGQAAKSSANLDKGKGKGKAVLVDVGLESDEGSDTIAQILGFKYAYYQGDEAPDVPANLHTTTALLIWHGYVKLTDLWAHLSPTDEDLAKLETKWRDEQAQLARSVGGANALAMAGALVDDEAPAAKPAASTPVNGTASTSAAPPPPPRDLPNQKVGLLRALLTIGDITHAFFILGQFPFLASAFPDIADLLNRLAHVSIDPAYASTSISRQHAQYADEFKAAKPKVTVDSKGEKKVTMPERKLALTSDAFPDPRRDWTFFFPRWQERVPRAGDWAGVVHLLEEMYLPLVKVFVARDFKLFTKLIRIAVADLAVDFANHPRRVNWLDLLRVHLVPAVSLLDSFTAASLELWRVLSLYPIETRFEIYGEWKDVHYRRNPVLGVRKAEAERDVKSLLRRLSTDNVKKLGKSFARIAHTNPAVIFAVALNQVQSYDNLIIPVVEACRYLTDLGYDIMAYSILDALSASKPKTKEDGTSIAMWLQGLATFTGHVYRRWIVMAPSLWVILQYLVNQLVSGNSKDLVVLRELIGRMTGFEPFADLSDAQVSSLAGGKYLRNEVFQKTDIAKASARGQQDGLVKAKNRLASSILDKGLAIPLAVNIALQRQACLKTDAHLKSLSSLFDQNHAILFQFNELLQAITTPDQLAELVPSVTDLLGRFKLDAGVAFDLARPRLRRALREYDEKEAADLAAEAAKKKQGLLAKLAKEKEKASPTPTDASAPAEGDDVKMGDVKEEGEQEESGTPPPPDAKVAMNGAVNDDAAMLDAVTAEVSLAPSKVPWHPGLVQIIQDVTELMPDGARKSIGAPFFTTFWQLALYDILYPKERYDAEIGRLKLLQREASASTALKPDDRRFFIDGVMTIANGLVEEAAKHMNARSTVNRRLTREKAQWFSDVSTTGQRQQLVHDILQYCLIPRSRLSLPDAVFSHQMIKRLHSMNTPQFHTIVLYDSLLTTQISPILYSCTENEARNFGRFLFDILADLYRWHKDKSAYVEEAANPQTSGFLRSMASTQAGEAGRVRGYYDHAEYQRAVLKWHTTMVQGFIDSFKSDEYMHIKNSILVLTKIAPYFPLDYTVGEKLERAVSELVVVEKREDLQILAQGYKAVISKRRPQWLNQPKTETTPVPPAPKPASATASPAVTPAASSKTSPDPAPAPARSSDTSRVPTGPKSSLPSRPGMRTADSDIKPPTGPAATRSTSDAPRRSDAPARTPTASSGDADKRQEPPTKPSSTATRMEPPRGPAASGGSSRSQPAKVDSGSRGSSRAASPRPADTDRDRHSRDSRDADRGRQRSRDRAREKEREQEREKERERDREREKDREKGKEKERERERARSVESSHSSRASRGEPRDSRDGRRDDRHDSRSDRRDVRDARAERRGSDRDRRSNDSKDARDIREADRSSRSSRGDERSSKAVDDRYASASSSTRREDTRRDDRRMSDRAKLSREAEAREVEKEKERERDRQREAQRDKERKDERDRRVRDADEASRSQQSGRGLPAKPPPPAGDRLRPAPAHRQPEPKSEQDPSKASLLERARASLPGGSSSTSPSGAVSERNSPCEDPAPLSIKGRGSSRLFNSLTSTGGGSGGGTSGSSNGGGKKEDDGSRKRSANSLADRLAPDSPKRARTDETPPHDPGRESSSGRGERGGGGRERSRR